MRPGWRSLTALVTAAAPSCTAPPSAATPPYNDASPVIVHEAGPVRAVDASPPSPLATPPVDLAADVQERTREARARFGAEARVEVVAGVFVLVEAGRPSPLFAQALALLRRAVPPLVDGRFTALPSPAVTVLLFPTHQAYAAYCQARYGEPGLDLGVYRRSFREIAADASGGANFLPTLTHEIVHPLMETDFPEAPLWIDEGIASLFEAPVFAKDGSIHGEARNWRHASLQRALASPTERGTVRLDALFGLSTRAFKGKAADGGGEVDEHARALHYAMARSVAAWLDSQGKLWPFYRAWREHAATDPSGKKAFEQIVGTTPEVANAAWTTWAR